MHGIKKVGGGRLFETAHGFAKPELYAGGISEAGVVTQHSAAHAYLFNVDF
jgi:hypothetical protein